MNTFRAYSLCNLWQKKKPYCKNSSKTIKKNLELVYRWENHEESAIEINK